MYNIYIYIHIHIIIVTIIVTIINLSIIIIVIIDSSRGAQPERLDDEGTHGTQSMARSCVYENMPISPGSQRATGVCRAQQRLIQ